MEVHTVCTPSIVFVEHRFEQNRGPGLPTAAANPPGFVSDPFGGSDDAGLRSGTGGISVTGDLTVFRFSTDDYPAHQRVMAWRELFGEHLLRLEIEAKERDRFQANATIRM